ncbi:hypothetical protein ABZ746_09925 [Streptomyces sp. NPDC020096]
MELPQLGARQPMEERGSVPGVVSTMPEATLNAVAEHGAVPVGSIRDTYGEAHQVLEDEGVEKFDANWSELVEKLAVSPHESDSGQPHRTDRSGEKV